jgi:hypothetical protein
MRYEDIYVAKLLADKLGQIVSQLSQANAIIAAINAENPAEPRPQHHLQTESITAYARGGDALAIFNVIVALLATQLEEVKAQLLAIGVVFGNVPHTED